jgi:amino acid adenylation domain-containing protein
LPVRSEAGGDATFAELLAQVTRGRADAVAWADYAPLSIADGLAVGFVSSHGARADAGAARLTVERVVTAEHLGLWLAHHDLEGAGTAWLAHDPAALDHEAAQRLARQLEKVLASVAADAGAELGAIELLGDDERRQVLVEFNATAAPVADTRIEQLFDARAAATPDACAVRDGSGSLSYGELQERANRLARRLERAGVEAGTVVGLCTDRSTDMVVGLLGILKAGAGFLPLHFEHPRARLEHQLQGAGCRVLVTQSPLLARLPAVEGDVICLDSDADAPGAEPATAPEHSGGLDDLAYVIYTSGSTGRPKGVGVTQANLANYVSDIVRRLDAGSAPLAFAMMTALSTDLGHTAVFPALCSGGTLVLVPPAEAADPAAVARRFAEAPVDVMKITPSHLGALLAAGDGRVLPRRWLFIGGERLGWDVVGAVRQLGACSIINHYGPTETTVGSCALPVPNDPGPFAPTSVPVGRPISNTRCYVLNARGAPVPLGAAGRLFIGGAGVARGYIGQPELTAERFSADPFADDGGRMYDTGDLARWLPDGTLEFLGRVDEQVKIRGFRVEPAEVEAMLREQPSVREAVVVARREGEGDPRLVAYCVHEPAVSHDDLRAHLAELVPDYMVPSAFVSLDALPLTPSGKVDRLSLPEPAAPGSGNGRVAPRTPMEESVAAIWADVLGVDAVGVDDDFFALGGHSLLAAQVVAQVRSDFAVELPMHSLFTMPTVETLAAEIGRLAGAADEDETAQLLAKLETLSDDEVERLLAEESSPLDEA